MNEITLTLSRHFETSYAEIHSKLSERLVVTKPLAKIEKSADPQALIELLGSAACWLPLSVAATAYLSRLAHRAADATWDKIAGNAEMKPLSDVVQVLAEAVTDTDRQVRIVVGIDVPDEFFGTSMLIQASSPKEIARLLASFVVHADALEKRMRTAIEEGRAPFGGATIQVQDDGSLLVNWVTRNSSRHEMRVP